MQTPDVTPIQKIVGAATVLIASVFTLLTAFGVDISAGQQAAVLGFVTSLGGFFVIADAVIRHGRSRALANPEAMRELERPAKAVTRD